MTRISHRHRATVGAGASPTHPDHAGWAASRPPLWPQFPVAFVFYTAALIQWKVTGCGLVICAYFICAQMAITT